MSYVISIDVGIVNLGLCIFDARSKQIVLWDRVPLRSSGGKYYPSRNVDYVREFVSKYAHYFDDARDLLIERQMRCNMRIVESVLHALYYDRCTVIAPRHVKVHYGIGGGGYRENKTKAVEWAREYVRHNAASFAESVREVFAASKKQDDLADSLLLLLYFLDTFSSVYSDFKSDATR